MWGQYEMIDGSAMRKLEAITGLEVKKLSPSCYGLYTSPSVAFFSFSADEKKACERLRQQNWKRIVDLACKCAAWKCERCGLRKPLQGHHKLTRARWSRSDGPLDAVDNVAALCSDCHSEEHRPSPSSKAPSIVDDLKDIDEIIESAESDLDG